MQRPEAVLVASQPQAVALDERRRPDQVAHLVRVDARDAHERRQERVDDERADDDARERKGGPAVSALGGHARGW